MPAQKIGINLLPKTEYEKSFWGQFLKWAISTGRYILILVELVVIIAFLSRFKFDKELADLSDNIAGKILVLDAYYSSEQNFRLIQTRLNSAGKLLGSQLGTQYVIRTINNYLPPEVSLTGLVITPSVVTINGRASTKDGLGVLLSRMTTDHSWKSIDLVDVFTTPTQEIQFTLTAKR